MKKNLAFLLAMLFLGATSCMNEVSPEIKHDPAADKEALVKLTIEDWDANALAGNMDANVEFYSGDAMMIQDGIILSGKEEIRTFLNSEIRPGFTTSSHENTLEDVRISGDLATVRGTFLGSWAHQEWGDTLWTKAAWVDVCERQEDNSWLIVFSMGTELGE